MKRKKNKTVNKCGGKRSGCSLSVVKKGTIEFPYYITDKAA